MVNKIQIESVGFFFFQTIVVFVHAPMGFPHGGPLPVIHMEV